MDFTGTLLNEYNSLPAYWWLWLIVVALVVWLIDGRRVTPRPLLAAYILFILMETIIGRKTGVGRVELVPFWSYSHPELRMEIVLNYILFIPFGLLLSLVKKGGEVEKAGEIESGVELSTGRIVLTGFLLAASIEIVQLVFRIGLFEFDDMIGNTIGCLIGAVVGKATRELKKRIEQAAPQDGVEER